MKEIWPAILVTGVSFAIPQFLISNFINPWIVDIGASLISMACLILLPEGLAAEGDLDLAGAAHARTNPPTTMPQAHRVDAQSHPPAKCGWRCCRGSSSASSC